MFSKKLHPFLKFCSISIMNSGTFEKISLKLKIIKIYQFRICKSNCRK